MSLKTVTFENIGLKGLNTDQAPWSMPSEYITAGINFRIHANTIIASGGHMHWALAPEQFNAGYLMHITSIVENQWLVAGRNKVFAFDGGNWADISSAAGYATLGVDDELLWSGCMIGQIPIVNNPQAHPEYWSPALAGQILQPLNFDPDNTWAEKAFSCKVIRSHKNVLFALNLNEGDEYPSAYRWSHPADINGLPYTWDTDDLSSLAGRAQIGGDSGAIIDGLSLRDSFVIYTETGIDILDFTGDEFVFRRRELSNTVGLNSSNTIVEVKGVHYFIGDGDILRNDGNSIESILHDRLRLSFTARINADTYNRSYAVRNSAMKEIWFCVPETNEEYPTIAYIYNWVDDSWALRQLPKTMVDSVEGVIPGMRSVFCAYGSQSSPTESWDEWAGDWNDQLRVWGSRRRTPLNDTLVGCTTDSDLIILDPGDEIIEDTGTLIERTNLALEGHGVVTSITEIIPHISGTEPVEIQLGSHDHAGSPVRWRPPVDFYPETMRKVNIRTTGELHAYRIKSKGKGRWRMSGMDVIYAISGAR